MKSTAELYHGTLLQLNELYRTLTPAAKISAAAMVAVVAISLAVMFRTRASVPNEYLLGGYGFSASELAAVETALAKAGLNDFELESNRIRIPSAQRAAYVAAMADGDALPIDFHHHFDSFTRGGSFWEPPRQTEVRYKLAQQKELALFIRAMDGIERASVQFDEAERGSFRRHKEITALVAVKPTGSRHLELERVRSIQKLVAASKAGLSVDNVTVTDLNAARSYAGPQELEPKPAETDYFASRTRSHEAVLTNKIRALLQYIQGVTVVTNVELVASSREDVRTQAVNSPPRDRTESGEFSASEPEQRPFAGNDSGPLLIPNRITVSIVVPSSYYRKVWSNRQSSVARPTSAQPNPIVLARIEEETKQKIKDAIVGLVQTRADTTIPYPHVIVTSFPDTDDVAAAPPRFVEYATAWLAENWKTLGTMLVGLTGLFLLHAVLRNALAGPPHGAKPGMTVSSADGQRPGGFGRSDDALKAEHPASVASLQNELTEKVQADPHLAANVISEWISKAS